MKDWQRTLKDLRSPDLPCPCMLQQRMARRIALDADRKQPCFWVLDGVIEPKRVRVLGRPDLVPKRAEEVAHGSVERILATTRMYLSGPG